MRFVISKKSIPPMRRRSVWAPPGVAGPLWIVADRQIRGRGRRGREWHSLAGNLSATLFLKPASRLAQCAELSFVAALAASDCVARFAPQARVALKWPNDILADGRKIAGILLETSRKGCGRAGLARHRLRHQPRLVSERLRVPRDISARHRRASASAARGADRARRLVGGMVWCLGHARICVCSRGVARARARIGSAHPGAPDRGRGSGSFRE